MTDINPSKEILNVVNSLFTSCADRSIEVQNSAIESAVQLSVANPQLILLSACNFLNNKGTSSKQHQINLLQVLRKSIKADNENRINTQLANKIVECSVAVMTSSKDVIPDLQSTASNVLVALCMKHFDIVWKTLENKLDPGVLPHYFIMKTLGSISVKHPTQSCERIPAVFGYILPMLGMIKHDNIKFVFATTVAEFSSSINEACSTNDQLNTKANLSSEALSTFEVIFNVWLTSKDQRVQLAVLEATSKIAYLLSDDKLEENFVKISQSILNMLKKSKDQLTILVTLTALIDACVQKKCTAVDLMFEQIWNTLFVITCALNDAELATNPIFKEVCKAFALLNNMFDHKQLSLILQRLDNRDETSKYFSLVILRHLVNFDSEKMKTGDKKGLIVSGLKAQLDDNTLKIKKNIAHTIMAIALQDFLSTEGGFSLIEFIVVNSSMTSVQHISSTAVSAKKKGKEDEISAVKELSSTCQNVLNRLLTNVDSLKTELWPNVLQFLTSPKCHHSVSILCSNLVMFIQEMNDSEDFYNVEFEEMVNLPQPIEMFTKLIIFASSPHNQTNGGLNSLSVLKLLAPFFDENVQQLWENVIPKLLTYLQDNEIQDQSSASKWEDLILKLFSKTLSILNEEETLVEIQQAILNQLTAYYVQSNDSHFKYFTYKCLGLLMRQSQSKKLVDTAISSLFVTVDHNDQLQREGCAVGFGYAAATHLDQILQKLDMILKGKPLIEQKMQESSSAPAKKSKGFFGGSSNSSSSASVKPADEKTKSTVMLAYGNVCFYAPFDLITSRMEATILRSLTPHFSTAKDLCLKQNVIRATQLLGRSMHENHLKQQYTFNNRDDLIKSILLIIHAEAPALLNTSTRQLGFMALSSLVQLKPLLTDADIFEIITTCSKSIMTVSEENNTHLVKKGDKLSNDGYIDLLRTTLDSFKDLMRELAKLADSFPQMFKLFEHLESDLLSGVSVQKQRALESCYVIFETYERMLSLGEDLSIQGLGQTLARLIPFCNDEAETIREQSLKCIEMLYQISTKMTSADEATKTAVVAMFDKIRELIVTTENSFSQLNDLTKIASFMVDIEEVLQFTTTLFAGISSTNPSQGAAICIALNNIFKNRSDQFKSSISAIVAEFSGALEAVLSVEKLKQGLLKSFKVFAVIHLKSIVHDLIFSQSLPLTESTTELWVSLFSINPNVTKQILRMFLDILGAKQPYEDKGGVKVASRVVIAISLIFEVIKTVKSAHQVCYFLLPELIVASITNIGSFMNTENIKPAATSSKGSSYAKVKNKKKGKDKDADGIAVGEDLSGQFTQQIVPREASGTALKSLLEILTDRLVTGNEESESEVSQKIESLSSKVGIKDSLFAGIHELADLIVKQFTSSLEKILSLASNVLNSVYEDQRIVVTALFGQMITSCCENNCNITLLENLMNSLLSKLIDTCYQVRKLALQGITNVVHADAEEVKKFSNPVLNALLLGLEDKENPNYEITLVCLEGLSRVLKVTDEPSARSVVITVYLRIKTCYEKDNAKVRNEAFKLFGILTKFATDQSKANIIDQIYSTMPTIILHTNDTDADVIESCKLCLKLIVPLLSCPKMKNHVETAHAQPVKTFHYGEFLNSISKSIIQEIPEKLNFFVMSNLHFFKSPYQVIRANSALFAGFLLGNMTSDQLHVVSIDHILTTLVQLLKDHDVNVRRNTAEALGLLTNLMAS